MCGFAVALDLAGQSRYEPWAMPMLRHRGPDAEGVMRDPTGNVSLEHCRLAIIDPENPGAAQPFEDPSGRWVIVYNGEIFNYRELRRDLERRGVVFRTNSDTEVVLLGYAHDGEEILQRLRGMFAFVVWDRRTNDVFAARDQIGVKPLYYYADDKLFAACSEIRPLLRHPSISARLDPEGVVEFLSFGKNLGRRTVIDGIRVLPPGHVLRVHGGDVAVAEYWDVLPAADGPSTPEEAEEALAALLEESVALSLVSDVPLGLMLSGGIDSSLVAALAVRHAPAAELTAYSVAFGRPDDEVAAASRLAADLGIRLRTIHVTQREVAADFDDWLDELDYPSGNPTWIATSFVARAAHEDGIKVLLSGDGGDELFGGYNRWMKYLRFHRDVWRRTPNRVRALAGSLFEDRIGGLWGDIARRAASGGELYVPSRPFHDDALRACLGPAGLAAFALSHPESGIRELRSRFDERYARNDYLAWMSYAALKTSLVEDFLARLDKMGMRYSVEGRVPLLDPVLARWSFSVSQESKIPSLRQKSLLRAAASRFLPAYVLDRPKQGFCAPIGAWCEGLLSDRAVPAESPLYESGLVRRDALEALRRKGDAGGFSAWTLSLLGEWTSRNLAGHDIRKAAAAS
ncbi:asparagine synthase (glutamine-hydrolyzing) [soil metagenome]